MRLFAGKRGLMEDLHVYLIQLVMILGYTIVIIAFAAAGVNNSLFERAYITRDLASITTAIIASPGNVFYTYDLTGYEFILEFSNKKIAAKDKNEKNSVFYSYASDLSYNVRDYISKDPLSKIIVKKIYIAKEGNIIRFNGTLNPNLNAIDCSFYGNESIKPKKVLIDIPHDAANPGYRIGNENTELLAICKIANYLLHQKNTSIEFSFTHPIDSSGNLDCFHRNPVGIPAVDYVVVIHGGALMSYELSPAKAYIQINSAKEKESSRLGCQLVNSILSPEKLEHFTGSALISADSSLTNTHIQIGAIDPAISTIVLEIGNVNIPKEKNQLLAPDVIGDALIRGLSSND
jgi:hypothetical protein